MKHYLWLAALLLASPANAAVVRFDFVSEVSVYDPDSGCVEADQGRDVAFCLGQAAPIFGGITLEVDDPDAINLSFEGSDADGEPPVSSGGRVLSYGARTGTGRVGSSGYVFTGISVTSTAPGAYDISMELLDDWDFGFGNTYAGWGDAQPGNFYSASGFWTATVVEPAPVPLPASGLLMLGLVPVAAGLRRMRRRD